MQSNTKYSLRNGVRQMRSSIERLGLSVGLLAAGLGVAVVAPVAVFAYGGDQTNQNQCGGKPVVNVTYQLTNDTDSAVGGGTWANDTVSRHLQISQVSDGAYCATVSDNGSFVTYDWHSPNNTGIVSAGLTGVISGGYRSDTITGSLVSNPTYKTKGNLGTFDLMCDRDQNCPGAHPSISSYVSGWDGGLDWWGWQYKTPQNGTWTNAIDGNSGDITS